jgi:hypothetical protein
MPAGSDNLVRMAQFLLGEPGGHPDPFHLNLPMPVSSDYDPEQQTLAEAQQQLAPPTAPPPPAAADPMLALQKAATIGASRPGERYLPQTLGEILSSANPALSAFRRLAEPLVGAGRPTSVAAADPTGIEAWQAGGPPPGLMMGSVEPVPFAAPRLGDLLKQVGGKEALKLGAAVSENPSLRTALTYLTPAEAKIVANFDPAQLGHFARVSDWLPPASYFGALARGGSGKIGWYQFSRDALEHVYGEDAGLFAGLLAATSPQNPVETNLLNATKIYRGWVQAGRPTDEPTILKIMGENVQGTKGVKSVLDSWINNTVGVLQGGDTLSGPKVDSFWANLRNRPGATDRVTLDAWMSHLLGLQQTNFAGSATPLQLAAGNPGYSPGYLATSAKLRQAATGTNLTPEQMQESMWSWGKALMEQAQNTGMTAQEIVKRGLLDPKAIAGTPDFSTLLHDPQFADVISSISPAHAKRLQTLTPASFDKSLPAQPGDQRLLVAAAKKLDELLATRRMESNLRVGTNPSPTSAMVTVPLEGVPGKSTGIAPEIFDPRITEGQRQNFGSAVLAPETNPRGQDVLLRATTGAPSTESTRGTGVFTPEGGPTEFNRLLAAGTQVPVTPGATVDTASPKWKAVELAVRLKAALSGQAAGAAHGLRFGGPAELNDALHVLTPNVVGGDALEGLSQLFPPSDYAIVNQGGSTQGKAGATLDILRLDQKPMTDADAAKVRTYLSGQGEKVTPKTITSAQNVAGFYGETPERGAGRVTKWALEHYDDLPTAQKGLDSPEVKQLAARKLAAYDAAAKRLKLTIPEDHRRMLQTIADGGVSALRKLYDSSKDLLPALVLMGLASAADFTPPRQDKS